MIDQVDIKGHVLHLAANVGETHVDVFGVLVFDFSENFISSHARVPLLSMSKVWLVGLDGGIAAFAGANANNLDNVGNKDLPVTNTACPGSGLNSLQSVLQLIV